MTDREKNTVLEKNTNLPGGTGRYGPICLSPGGGSTCNNKLLEGPNYLWPSVVMVKSKILLYYQKNKKNVMLNLWCTEKRGKVKDFFSLKVREKNVTLELWSTVRPVKLSKWTHIMCRLGRGWCKVKIILCPIKKGERGSPPKERKRLFLFK